MNLVDRKNVSNLLNEISASVINSKGKSKTKHMSKIGFIREDGKVYRAVLKVDIVEDTNECI